MYPATVILRSTAAALCLLSLAPLRGEEKYPLPQAHLLEPFWRQPEVYGEAVACLRDHPGEPATGTLLFAPAKILRVQSSDGKTVYQEGVDYEVDKANRRIIIPPSSRIAVLEKKDLYKSATDQQAMKHKAGDPTTYLFYAEAWFRTIQVEVDYVRGEEWTGYRPAAGPGSLPATKARLREGKPLTICVTGDSIAAGANASKTKAPFMPAYPRLIQQALEATWKSPVALHNLAIPGTTAKGGLDRIHQILEKQPDLVIIAFGMNDVAEKKPGYYAERITAMIKAIREQSPGTECIIVTSTLANPEWSWSPAEEFPKYREAILPLAGEGVALADMTQLTSDIMQKKSYFDLTGNGINHPNDYMHRLYAQVVLSLLSDQAGDTSPESAY